MPRAENKAAGLLQRLEQAGYAKPYVKKTVLPDWWNASLVEDDAAYYETVGHIANGLGLDPESLLDPNAEIRRKQGIEAKFKAPRGVEDQELKQAVGIVERIARVASEACTTPPGPLPSSPREVRESILATEDCISFNNLLEYCWNLGIIVLPVTTFPGKKPDGMALMVDGRPVIVLCKSATHPAWTAFDLAHELGHLVLGHVDVTGVVVDKKIDGLDTNKEESEANEFAVQLLAGHPEASFQSDYRLQAEVLASTAKVIGRKHSIDPGVIVLNYARTMEQSGLPCWPLANAALKFIPADYSPQPLLREHLLAHLDLNELGRDTRNWLLKATESR